MYTSINSYKPLFADPPSVGHVKVEHLYDSIIGGSFPSRLVIQDPLEVTKVSDFLNEHFERLFSDSTYSSGEFYENSSWRGRGKYADVFLDLGELRHPGATGTFMSAYYDEHTDLEKNAKNSCRVSLASTNMPLLKEICATLSVFASKKSTKIYLLSTTYGEVGLEPLDVPPGDVDLGLNYGRSFLDVHQDVVDSLQNKRSGLYLFYGDPGTGKSSYIKYLLSAVTTRKIAYVPVALIDSLVSPDFLPLLTANRNLILVIEDAEKALVSREEGTGSSSVVSAMLNLTDSFIGNTLNVSIIATFNTKKDNIDKALLRKGRLKLSHEFKELNVEDAQALINSLSIDYRATEPMSLAEIYHLHEDNRFKADDNTRVIGFGGS